MSLPSSLPASMGEGIFLWARSGGGHRTAKDALVERKIAEYKDQGVALKTRDIDITSDKVLNAVKLPFIGGIGDFGVNAWDSAQKRGDINQLSQIAWWGWLAEIVCYPIVYFQTKWLLQDMKAPPEFLVSTQAFCISAVVNAMLRVNREKGWNMKMQVYLTDLPSKKATHFFPSIKKVGDSPLLSPHLTLYSPPPSLKDGQTEQEFFEKKCGKHIRVITREQFPIRKAFLNEQILAEQLAEDITTISIKLHNEEEQTALQNSVDTNIVNNNAHVKIRKSDKLAFLMLGSQPTTQSVIHWLDSFKSNARTMGNEKHYLFLYCGAPETGGTVNPLLRAVRTKLQEEPLCDHLQVIPFTNQDADTIALLMARADCTITRSGGATCMELLHLMRSQHLPKRDNKLTLIHAESVRYDTVEEQEKKIEEELKKIEQKNRHNQKTAAEKRAIARSQVLRNEGIVVWEASNAKYLEREIAAQVVTPQSAEEILKNGFYGE